jgi:hypothetical protein
MAAITNALTLARSVLTSTFPTLASADRIFSPGDDFDPAALNNSPDAWLSLGPPAKVFEDHTNGRTTVAVSVDVAAADYATAFAAAEALDSALSWRTRDPGRAQNVTLNGPFRETSPDYYRAIVRFTLTVNP